MESLRQDLLYSFRVLAKNPGFTVVALLALALGIGANSAIFSVVNAVLLRPLPFSEPERLFTLWERNPKVGYDQNWPAAANIIDWRNQNEVFSGVAAYNPSVSFNLSADENPERIDGAAVSSSLFDVLQVR